MTWFFRALGQPCLAVLALTALAHSSLAQTPDQVLGEMLRQFQLQHAPKPPAVGGQRYFAPPVVGQKEISSSKPTINCTDVQSSVGKILCVDEIAAKADWEVNAASWAYLGTLDDHPAARTLFQKDQNDWIQSIPRICKLPGRSIEQGTQCVVKAYRSRTKALRSRLTGAALDEAQLLPEQRAALQSQLANLGLLPDNKIDGEFGPTTRAAIRAFQERAGSSPTGYLSAQERETLLARDEQAQEPPTAADARGSAVLTTRQANSDARYPSHETETIQSRGFATAPTGGSVSVQLVTSGSQKQNEQARSVDVSGVGESPDAARKDAVRQAIQQTVGVYVDARRRVEIKMSDEKLNQIVEETLLSYSSAYATKIEVLSTEHRASDYMVRARVTVAIAPLLETLRANKVPTVPFDAHSVQAAADSLSDEKTNALTIYSDLLARIDKLVSVGLGEPKPAESIPSAAGWTWIAVPMTFFINDDAAQEWKTKFGQIAKSRVRLTLNYWNIGTGRIPGCALPELEVRSIFMLNPSRPFFIQTPAAGEQGVAACFLNRAGPTTFDSECFERRFVCNEPNCQSLLSATSGIRLVVDFLDERQESIRHLEIPVPGFPHFNRVSSRLRPDGNENAFFNFCVGKPNAFFAVNKVGSRDPSETLHHDTIFFPPAGSRINGLLNVLFPNETLGRISSVRAFIKNAKDDNTLERSQ